MLGGAHKAGMQPAAQQNFQQRAALPGRVTGDDAACGFWQQAENVRPLLRSYKGLAAVSPGLMDLQAHPKAWVMGLWHSSTARNEISWVPRLILTECVSDALGSEGTGPLAWEGRAIACSRWSSGRLPCSTVHTVHWAGLQDVPHIWPL